MTDLNYIPSLTYVPPAHSRVVAFTESPPVANLPPYAGVVSPGKVIYRKDASPVKRTRGQEIAEAMLRGGGTNIILLRDEGSVGFNVTEGTDDWVRKGIAQVVSAAIDAALAEQREIHALLAEHFLSSGEFYSPIASGCNHACRDIAAAIRNAD